MLIVEDDEETLQLWQVALAQEGNVVRVATCGTDALETAEQFHPDVVLIDIGLPDIDGFRLATLLRELRRCRMIAVSGRSSESRVARSICAGFEAYLTKPIDVRELLYLLATPAGVIARSSP